MILGAVWLSAVWVATFRTFYVGYRQRHRSAVIASFVTALALLVALL